MINNSRGKKIKAKQEADTNDIKLWKTTTSSSRQLARFSNPRIVRVSRSFGGKDRHSKVFTIRGLRDRRIRLSVPTAIQLYDLQEKLGLSQPSKVIDWLLEANEHEIDKLPPLQMPLGDFSQFHEQTLVPHELNAPQPFFNLNAEFMKDRGNSKYLTNSDADSSRKYIEIGRENIFEHNRWNITRNEKETQENPQHSAQNLFPSANQFSFPPNNTSSYNCDPSNLSLSQFGNQGFPSWFPSQGDTHNTTQSASLPSSQLFFCPPAIAPSFFPPYMMSTNSSVEGELRNSNQFQFLSATSQNVVPNSLVSPLHSISPFNANPKVNLQNNNDTNK